MENPVSSGDPIAHGSLTSSQKLSYRKRCTEEHRGCPSSKQMKSEVWSGSNEIVVTRTKRHEMQNFKDDFEEKSEICVLAKCLSEFSDTKFNIVKESLMSTSLDQIAAAFRARKRADNELFVNKFLADIAPDKNEIAEEELKKEISKDIFRKAVLSSTHNYTDKPKAVPLKSPVKVSMKAAVPLPEVTESSAAVKTNGLVIKMDSSPPKVVRLPSAKSITPPKTAAKTSPVKPALSRNNSRGDNIVLPVKSESSNELEWK
ncbi:hypothetical protein V9T40_004910 [Parthenolecanium corni]|uniref:Uncharacterized protein n=1 Tax=Parthenolecanium corni TaxID=536013 RepID=A0AAN9TR49_9HEMI